MDPKLHKNLTKTRFIIASPKCSVKPFSKAIKNALMLTYRQFENYRFKIRLCSGVKTRWPVQSNQSLINKLNTLNTQANQIQERKPFQFPRLISPFFIRIIHIIEWNQRWMSWSVSVWMVVIKICLIDMFNRDICLLIKHL